MYEGESSKEHVSCSSRQKHLSVMDRRMMEKWSLYVRLHNEELCAQDFNIIHFTSKEQEHAGTERHEQIYMPPT